MEIGLETQLDYVSINLVVRTQSGQKVKRPEANWLITNASTSCATFGFECISRMHEIKCDFTFIECKYLLNVSSNSNKCCLWHSYFGILLFSLFIFMGIYMCHCRSLKSHKLHKNLKGVTSVNIYSLTNWASDILTERERERLTRLISLKTRAGNGSIKL